MPALFPPAPATPDTPPDALPGRFSHRQLFALLCSFLLLALWDATSGDLVTARWFGTVQGFPLKEHWFWSGVLHDLARPVPWMVEIALILSIWWPMKALRPLAQARRVQLALSTLVSLLLVSYIKMHSTSSCPWALQDFGGTATYLSHWAWGVRDGGAGVCFPAGHASGGFAFLGGYFVFSHGFPRAAKRWLLGALAAGLVLGLAQQVRGAHFMSHTLWTAWLCWLSAVVVDQLFSRWTSQNSSPAPIWGRDRAAPLPLTPPESHG